MARPIADKNDIGRVLMGFGVGRGRDLGIWAKMKWGMDCLGLTFLRVTARQTQHFI